MTYFACVVLFRYCLPLCILIASVIRPSLLSAAYCILLFITPLIPVPTKKTMEGITATFLKCVMGISVLGAALHGAFHVIIALQSKGYDGTLTNCTSDEILFRNLGFVTFGNNIQIETAILRVAPEAIMVIVSIGFFILFKRLTQAGIPTLMESMESAESPENAEEDLKFFKKYSNIFLQMGRHLVLTLFCIASISKPSIPGALYFLIYFGTATWWACCKPLQRMFGLFLCGLSPFVLLNILVLYFYQSEYFSDFVPTDSLGARLSGLTILTETGCHGSNFTGDPRQIVYNAPWPFYVHAVTLFILFHIMVLLGKELLLPEEKTSDTNLEQEESPLIRGNSPSKRYGSVRKSILSGKGSEDIPMDSMSKHIMHESEGESSVSAPSIMDNIIFILVAIINAVVTVSYLGTNIIMMAWSITFTCWISFVLLIWANLMWLVPHQRKAMLRSSPYLLAYVFCVLAAIYVLSLDLTPSELPRDFKGVNMKEIGLEKEDFKNMAIKCIFTVMFFITLRQYMQERIIEKQTSAIADMVAPLQVTVGAATSGAEAEKTPGVKIMDKLGALIVNFLTKFWIWVVAAMLFAVAITGQRMTGFRIVYMALFLIFLLTFQLSFKIWRKMMFAFWLIVILFSMIVLVATYTYQFDNFSSYWTDYLHIDKEQQLDIGLQVFETKQLFVRLLTPTSFVIISVIQLHYFHKDFMKLSDPNSSGEKVEENVDVDKEMNESSLQGGAYSDKSVKDDTTTESGKYEFSELKDFKHKKKFENFLRQFDHFKNKLFIFLEIHMLKLVLFFAMILCVEDKCAVYSSIIILITLSFLFGRPMQLFAVYTTSVIVSLMLLGRMLYQIKYVTPSNWDVNCTDTNENFVRGMTQWRSLLVKDITFLSILSSLVKEPKGNTTEIVTKNNGPWFGFVKTDSLSEHVKWNIIYLLVVTLWSIVQVRQYYHRLSRGQSTLRAFFMFPNIKRADAEKNLTNMLKYLANYGFFKFGLEFSLIILVGYIGIRMDAYALIQACWLMLMFFMSRKRLAKIWVFYLIFTALTLPIQYFMVLALPPSMCIIYPWNDSSVYLRLQEWAFLLNDTPPLPARKLIFDFILLLAISRQWVVFRIEKRYAGKNYAGGHNDSIIHLADREDFENPVPDFVTYVRSYLDIAKRVVLLSWFWITLALGFLAGTNRVNIFSLGYLMGAFYFLWQGTDIYLRPIKRILKAWNCFIFFNVTVIFLKTVFQIIGCVYVEKVAHDACWVMYLFGIGCVRKFGDIETNTDMEEQHECEMKNEFLGLFWDAMCFAFLIMQRRLFNSFNFLRIIDDTKAGTILASRGAELMEEMRIKRMHEQINTEQNVLKKIKLKMDRIKATQQKMQEKQPPLARAVSESSCTTATSRGTTPAGYHTPIEEEEPAPLTPRSSLIHPQAPPSPYSAVMTVSLEGYLEPQRISFSSPPNSELNPRPPSPDESFPVFSPPPYDEAPPYVEVVSVRPAMPVQRQTSIGPPWMQGSLITPRQSVISYSTRSHFSHHELHQLKVYWRTQTDNHYEETLLKTTGRKRREPETFKEAIRSGDYYMFEDMDIEEIDILPEQTEKDEDRPPSDIPTLGEFMHDTVQTDIDTVVRQRKKSWKRRKTMPLTRSKTTRSTMSAPPAGGVATTKSSSTPRSVTIRESDIKPGTSQDEEDDILSDISESELSGKKESLVAKGMKYWYFVWAFVESAMLSLTNFYSKYTRDYRYVMKVLGQEKKILKERTKYNIGKRVGTEQLWQPSGTYHELLGQSAEDISNMSLDGLSRTDSFRFGLVAERKTSMQNTDTDVNDKQSNISDDSDTKAMASPLPYTGELERRKASVLTVPEIRIMAPSLERGLDSPTSLSSNGKKHKDKDSQDDEMSQYDQPVFMRLLLAHWYLVLRHSEVLCYFMIFLNQAQTATFLSIPLPIMVFFWGTLTIPRPSKTFWVTIIAYTEVTVLIKCLFQLDIIPWNDEIVINNPFFPPKVIGIERKENYALYDLVLLLVVFFHRMLLKNMGIWTTVNVSLPQTPHKEKDYELVDGQLVSAEDNTVPKSKSDEDDVSLKSEEVHRYRYYAKSLQLSVSKYAETFKYFSKQLLDPTARVVADVYTYMFLCDFTNFFVLIFGFSSFGGQQYGNVSTFVKENKIPPLFLFMLMLQFFLIIVDRGIYLRKNIVGKIIFQIIQVLFLHIWLFVLFPILTEKEFTKEVPPQVFYFIKCIYFLLSAYQIRCGYPTRTLGNFLCKGFGIVNLVGFKAYILCPFVFELRAIMDWMWTETSMGVFDWLKMEDIFSHIFQIKCSRQLEEDYPQKRGTKKGYLVKYTLGGFLLLFIVIIIWLPLILFSMVGSVGVSNAPTDITIELRIGQYPPIYHMSAQGNALYQFNSLDFSKFQQVFNKQKKALEVLSYYTPEDTVAAQLSIDSSSLWLISPPDREKMVEEVKSEKSLNIRFDFQVTKKAAAEGESATLKNHIDVAIPPSTKNRPNENRENLLKMLQSADTSNITAVNIPFIFPKFLKVTNQGDLESAGPFMQMFSSNNELEREYRNLTLSLLKTTGVVTQEWWHVTECNRLSEKEDKNYKYFLEHLPYSDCDKLVIYTFNDRIFPDTLSIVTAGGIIGVYGSIVYILSRVLRGMFAEQVFKILYEDLPNVDRIVQLCLDVYLVREAREFMLEEDLFAKLIFLFRSPETLIKWTRPPEEIGDEDEDAED